MSLDLALTWEGHRVRMVGTAERPEWIARDVCRVLGIHNTSRALANAGVLEAEKGVHRVNTPGGPQDVTTVLEAGLWKLVLISRKPGARRFKDWLAAEVLPSLRKDGRYPPREVPALVAVDLRNPLQLAAITAQALQLVAELQPKAQAHDRLSAARGDVCLQDAGRILGRPPNVFCQQLEEDGILFRGSHGKLEPYAHHREAGLFRVRVTEAQGETYLQTLVTPPGLQWLAGRYPRQDALRPGNGGSR